MGLMFREARSADDAGDDVSTVKSVFEDLLLDLANAVFEFVPGCDSSSGFLVVILKLLGYDSVLSV